MKRVLAYTRISRADRAREQSLGIDAQRTAILAAAAQHGWEIVGWFTDEGVPGRTLRRPGITAALARRGNASPRVGGSPGPVSVRRPTPSP